VKWFRGSHRILQRELYNRKHTFLLNFIIFEQKFYVFFIDLQKKKNVIMNLKSDLYSKFIRAKLSFFLATISLYNACPHYHVPWKRPEREDYKKKKRKERDIVRFEQHRIFFSFLGKMKERSKRWGRFSSVLEPSAWSKRSKDREATGTHARRWWRVATSAFCHMRNRVYATSTSAGK